MPETTAQIINTITAAGLDYRNFKCEIIAHRVSEIDEPNVWEWIAEFPRRDHPDVDRAWQLAGIPDAYRDAA